MTVEHVTPTERIRLDNKTGKWKWQASIRYGYGVHPLTESGVCRWRFMARFRAKQALNRMNPPSLPGDPDE